MSYSTLKAYFKRRLASFKLTEAPNGLDFESESENYNNKYSIENPVTELGQGDNLATRFFPTRTYVIHLAFKMSESSANKEYDNAHALIENIFRDIHSVSNYRADNLRIVRFTTSKVSVVKGYIYCEMSFTAEDTLNYV